MNTIPTAEEFLEKYSKNYGQAIGNPRAILKASEALEAMIEFAKIHVKAALEAASENAQMELVCDTPETEYIDKDSILKSYPLTNIK